MNMEVYLLSSRLLEVKQKYKTDTTPVKEKISMTIKALRTNSIEEEGFVYSIADQEAGQMVDYDERGNLLNTRPLLPEERQRHVGFDSMMMSTGTND
jgi:hypothetical protein